MVIEVFNDIVIALPITYRGVAWNFALVLINSTIRRIKTALIIK